jgi:UDP-N-acetylglucosamine 2-epimerase
MKYLTIIGTRPEIIRLCDWEKEILFTGQHFNYEMGERFLSDLQHPYTDECRTIHYLSYDIDHSDIEVIAKEGKKKVKEIKPDCIIVHGDTRSALAGARIAHDLKILLAHTEAGVRAKDETIEQIYRREIDYLSNYNFCPVPNAVDFLRDEGINEGVYFIGDTLYDKFLRKHCKDSWDFVFVTIHRKENIEDRNRLQSLIDNLTQYKNVIFPIHPHTQECLDKFGIELSSNIIKKPPLTYEETLNFIRDAKLILTDSGGIQREAFWSGTPCKVLRPSSEWGYYTTCFGDGNAGAKMLEILETKQPHR